MESRLKYFHRYYQQTPGTMDEDELRDSLDLLSSILAVSSQQSHAHGTAESQLKKFHRY